MKFKFQCSLLKFYWKAETFLCLCTVCGCFTKSIWPAKLKCLRAASLRKKVFANLWFNILRVRSLRNILLNTFTTWRAFYSAGFDRQYDFSQDLSVRSKIMYPHLMPMRLGCHPMDPARIPAPATLGSVMTRFGQQNISRCDVSGTFNVLAEFGLGFWASDLPCGSSHLLWNPAAPAWEIHRAARNLTRSTQLCRVVESHGGVRIVCYAKTCLTLWGSSLIIYGDVWVASLHWKYNWKSH